MNTIRDHLNEVRENIQKACEKAGRSPQEVTLIAVSKTKPLFMLEEAYEAGARDFGENKVQEILEKHPKMPEDARFHMIGHLQRNKVKQVLPHAVLIHSVDSYRLAEQISQEAGKLGITAKILLEVNVAKRGEQVWHDAGRCGGNGRSDCSTSASSDRRSYDHCAFRR